MAGKIIIDTQQCKGCGLCISVCPKNSIVVSDSSNKTGYFPAEATNENCTGCAMCAIVCPDAVIEVQKQSNIISVEVKKQSKTITIGTNKDKSKDSEVLIEEKA